MTRLSVTGLVGVLVLFAGCAAESDSEPSAFTGRHDASAQVRPDLMEIEPTRAEPGEVLAVRFPQETDRGVAFVLEAETAEGWDLRYFLVAGSEAVGVAEWWTPADAKGRGWDDVGIAGPGPDFVEVPDAATPGDCRLCTANAVENVCATVEVTA